MTSTSIAWPLRLLLTTAEPICATLGAIMAFRTPAQYLGTMTRNTVKFRYDSTFLYTELGGAWLYFAFVEAIVLRFFDDVRLWRFLCAGMLLSDIAYVHSIAQALGGWRAWSVLADWTAEDWAVTISTVPFLFARILIVLGIGVKGPKVVGKKE